MNERLHNVKKALGLTDEKMGKLMGYTGASGYNNLVNGDMKIPEARLRLLENKGINIKYLNGESDSIFVSDIQNMEAEPASQPGNSLTNQIKPMKSDYYELRLKEKQQEIDRLWGLLYDMRKDIIERLGEVKTLLNQKK